MRFKSLSTLKRQPETEEPWWAEGLPQDVLMTDYARKKAFKISELVKKIHRSSYEWYGFTMADGQSPEVIVDIGLPRNDRNIHQYVAIGPEKIAEYQESLTSDVVINGWIHSHGNLGFRQFSGIDERNHITVLDYVTALLRRPLGRKEIPLDDLVLLVKGHETDCDAREGRVCLVTDLPVGEARILEAVYGGFSYGIVIGDEGWHRQAIHYRRRGILTGHVSLSRKDAHLVVLGTGRSMSRHEIDELGGEVQEKVRPPRANTTVLKPRKSGKAK